MVEILYGCSILRHMVENLYGSENGYPFKRIAQNGSCARAPCVAQTAFQGVKLGALITWLLV